MSTVESILSAAAALSIAEQRDLANRLWDQVEAADENEISDEMKATLDRRWEEIISGKVKCIPHEEMMAKLRAKHGY